MKKILFLIAVVTLFLTACRKTEDFERTRLFRPVLKDQLFSEGNWIEARWQKIGSALSYTAQLSRDTFKTILTTVKVDTNYVRFENLGWEKTYQIQVRANAEDTVFNSKYSYLGEIKTPRFPTILNVPGVSDIADKAVKVSWANSGAAVSRIRIIQTADSSTVRDVTVTQADIANKYRIVNGLQPATLYTIFLYSGTTVRGWADFTTKASLSGTIIDLRDIEGRPSILIDTIPVIPSGSIVLLKRGETYEVSSTTEIGKSITIMSGTDLTATEQAKLYFTSNFNFEEGSVIDSIEFNDVYLYGSSYSSKYVFNTTKTATVGKMKFVNCRAEIFRGLVRLQSGNTTLSTFLIDKSVVDSISNYGVFIVDNAAIQAQNVILRNSTFYKVEKIISSTKQNIGSVLIENCTFNEAPLAGGSNWIVDLGSKNATNGVTLNNNIFGIGKAKPGLTTLEVKDVRAGSGTTINAGNNFRTADHVSAGDDLPNISIHTRPSTELWKNPDNGNFQIIDNSFPGRSNAGDPRWRM